MPCLIASPILKLPLAFTCTLGLATPGGGVVPPGPVVGGAADPRQPAAEQLALDPGAIGAAQLGHDAAIAIAAGAAGDELHRLAEHQGGERGPRGVGERPGLVVRPVERALGRCDSGEAELTSVGQHHRVAVDHRGDHRLSAVGGLVGPGFDRPSQDQRQKEQDGREARHGCAARRKSIFFRF